MLSANNFKNLSSTPSFLPYKETVEKETYFFPLFKEMQTRKIFHLFPMIFPSLLPFHDCFHLMVIPTSCLSFISNSSVQGT